jgi:hypothetical protein
MLCSVLRSCYKDILARIPPSAGCTRVGASCAIVGTVESGRGVASGRWSDVSERRRARRVANGRGDRSFFRLAKSYPPSDADYRTQRDFRGDPPPDSSEEELWSWDAYSAYDTEDGARQQGRRIPRLGKFVVRYDIPADSGIAIRKTFGPGHYGLRGDKEERHSYLADFVAEV